jgi:predicted RNA-binding Zn-ribbon protein involved in translation (DUF1610 family)
MAGSKEKSCGNKIKFRSHKSALNFMSKKFMSLRCLATLKPYRCPYCGRYHIGHYDKRLKGE